MSGAALEFRLRVEATRRGTNKWCVCWAGEVEGEPFRSYRGDPISWAEVQRRLAWGRAMYPQLIYWLEAA